MPKHTANNFPCAALPLPVYSQAVISHRTVYVSGTVGCNEEGLIVGGVQQQIKAALDNLQTRLEAAGSDLAHVVKVTVYLANLARDFDVFNEIYTSYFLGLELPARTCVGVAALPLGAFVEVECIAELARSEN